MANDRTTIIIDADASGVAEGVRQADQSLGKLSSSVDDQNKSLNMYGERLGKAFGPNEGLHGRLDSLESPLRDTEGAIMRSQMAFIEFGKSGATASDKIGAGFLLAGDAIAAFTSGGVVGIGIAAAVAGFSLINSLMEEEAQLAKEAEEAQKKHAEELQNLAKSAAAANATIALLNAKQRKDEAIERARALEQEVEDSKKRYEELAKQHNQEVDRFNKLSALAQSTEESKRLDAQATELDQLETHATKLKDEYDGLLNGPFGIRYLNQKVLEEQAKSSGNLLTQLIESFNKTDEVTTKAVEKETKKRVRAVRQVQDVMGKYAKWEKEQTIAQQEMRKEDERVEARFRKRREQELEHERQVERDNREFDRAEKRRGAKIAVEIAREESEKKLAANRVVYLRAEKARKENLAAEKKAADERKAMALGVAQSVTSALFEQAKAGELSAEKLLESVLASTGQQLVARGTLHLFEGIATSNPATAGTGGAMIAAGLAMGATAGAISRSGEESAATTAASTPTDTRESRAASGSSGGEGGTTIINFNGPAYDKRGVANVITSGQRMAKHRRIAGA